MPTTVIATDALARFQRLDGKDVFFLTGTDEHGLKMQQTARKEGITPQELADRNSAIFRAMDAALSASNDDFIRTTEQRHYAACQAIWKAMAANGDIYLGPLCRLVFGAPGSLFRREGDRPSATTACAASRSARRSNGSRRRATSSGSPPIRTGCSRTTRANPDFIGPAERRNEVVSFVKSGLKDLSISRTTFDWGVPVPGDDKHVMYVWVDALTNYITARRLSRRRRPSAGATGRPTSTSSARTSCASTPSTGRPS